MKKMMLILAILVLFLSFGQLDGKENPILQDVTGDGKAEKIYRKDISFPGTNTSHFRLIIQEETTRGWKNIFPKECFVPCASGNPKMVDCTIISRNSWGDFGGYFIDKYSSRFPGQQILIYFPCQSNEPNVANYFEAYFFKKEPQDKVFVLYRKDITDGKYQHNSQLAEELKKEFQQETKFTKAHKIANDFWRALMKGERSKIYSFLCNDPNDDYWNSYLKDLVEICQKQKECLQKASLVFYSFNGVARTMDDKKVEISEYLFIAQNKRYKIYIAVSPLIFKISGLSEEENGKPKFGVQYF